jgi:hypothetical protein
MENMAVHNDAFFQARAWLAMWQRNGLDAGRVPSPFQGKHHTLAFKGARHCDLCFSLPAEMVILDLKLLILPQS